MCPNENNRMVMNADLQHAHAIKVHDIPKVQETNLNNKNKTPMYSLTNEICHADHCL